jgi:hypothetical protein
MLTQIIGKRIYKRKKRMQGKQYKGIAKSNEGKSAFILERKERIMCKRNCSKWCKKSKMCFELSEHQRQKNFNNFWNNLNRDEKRMYVRGLVDICVPQTSAEGSRKSQTLKCNLKIEGQANKDKLNSVQRAFVKAKAKEITDTGSTVTTSSVSQIIREGIEERL